jgi:AcrR family transcriptional regulator
MSPRPDVSEKRKDQILDAATDVFSRRGFHDARVDDIAKEAGLSKGTLYWYFKSKDDIIIGLLDRLFEFGASGVRELQSKEIPATEMLRQSVDLLLKDLDRWINLIPLAYEFLGLLFRRKIVQAAFKRYFRHYMDLITPIIQQGIDEGEFQADSAKEVAIAIGAIFEGTILLWVYDSEMVKIKEDIHRSIELLINGIQV